MEAPFEPFPYFVGEDPLEIALKTQGMPNQVIQNDIPLANESEALRLRKSMLPLDTPVSEADIAWQNRMFGDMPQEQRAAPFYRVEEGVKNSTGIDALNFMQKNFLEDPDYKGFNVENNPVFKTALEPFTLDPKAFYNVLDIATESWCASFLSGILRTGSDDFVNEFSPESGSEDYPSYPQIRATEYSKVGDLIVDSKDKEPLPKDAKKGTIPNLKRFNTIKPGDIIVFSKGGARRAGEGELGGFVQDDGHVALVESVEGDTITYVGGNQKSSPRVYNELNSSSFNYKETSKNFKVMRLNKPKVQKLLGNK